MSKTIVKIVAIFLIGIVGGIFADQILWPYFIERPLFLKYDLEQNPVYVTERKEITIQENIALQGAIEKVEKVMTGIQTKTKTGKFIEGSGLIVTSDGLIVTLAELAPKGSSFTLWQNKTQLSSKNNEPRILKRDSKNNLVLIKIDQTNLNTTGFADIEKIKLGERVFLVNTILKQEDTKEIISVITVNQGIITYFDQDFLYTNISEKRTALGSSLFDIEGNVLGINFINKDGKITTIPSPIIRDFIGF